MVPEILSISRCLAILCPSNQLADEAASVSRGQKMYNFLYDYDADFVQCSVVLYGDFVWEHTSFNFLSTGLSITFIHPMRAEGAIVAERFCRRR